MSASAGFQNDPFHISGDLLFRETVEIGNGGLLQPFPQTVVGYQRLDFRREFARVVGSAQQTVLAVFDYFGLTAFIVARDASAMLRHGFDERKPPAFETRREDEDRGFAILLDYIFGKRLSLIHI